MFGTHMTGPDRGYLIQSFFCPDSAETYVGNLRHVPALIAGHSYWTNTPVEAMKRYREELNDTLNKYGTGFWQSEVCIMGNDEEIGGGHGYDRTMKTALYVFCNSIATRPETTLSWIQNCSGPWVITAVLSVLEPEG